MTNEFKHLIDPDGRFYDIVAPVVDDLGYRLIRVAFAGSDPKRGTILNISIEPKDGSKLKIDDCKKVSNDLSAVMDVADPIPDNYVLEVGSAGLDRPLTNKNDFNRFQGYEAKLECKYADDQGQRRFRGIIQSCDDNKIILSTAERGDLEIEFVTLSNARLVASDQLLKDLQENKV